MRSTGRSATSTCGGRRGLGSVFRGILLGTMLPEVGDLAAEFYKCHRSSNETLFDPFMGSGTTIGEAQKLGFTAIGRDRFELSRNDRKIVILGHLLMTLGSPDELDSIAHYAEGPIDEAGLTRNAITARGHLRLLD